MKLLFGDENFAILTQNGKNDFAGKEITTLSDDKIIK